MFFRNHTAPAGLWRFIKNDGYLDTLCFVVAVVAMFSCARERFKRETTESAVWSLFEWIEIAACDLVYGSLYTREKRA
jgi:hypothetical protein